MVVAMSIWCRAVVEFFANEVTETNYDDKKVLKCM